MQPFRLWYGYATTVSLRGYPSVAFSGTPVRAGPEVNAHLVRAAFAIFMLAEGIESGHYARGFAKIERGGALLNTHGTACIQPAEPRLSP
jgi:hypothetical protein